MGVACGGAGAFDALDWLSAQNPLVKNLRKKYLLDQWHMAKLTQCFNRLDLDGNGDLDIGEFSKLLENDNPEMNIGHLEGYVGRLYEQLGKAVEVAQRERRMQLRTKRASTKLVQAIDEGMSDSDIRFCAFITIVVGYCNKSPDEIIHYSYEVFKGKKRHLTTKMIRDSLSSMTTNENEGETAKTELDINERVLQSQKYTLRHSLKFFNNLFPESLDQEISPKQFAVVSKDCPYLARPAAQVQLLMREGTFGAKAWEKLKDKQAKAKKKERAKFLRDLKKKGKNEKEYAYEQKEVTEKAPLSKAEREVEKKIKKEMADEVKKKQQDIFEAKVRKKAKKAVMREEKKKSWYMAAAEKGLNDKMKAELEKKVEEKVKAELEKKEDWQQCAGAYRSTKKDKKKKRRKNSSVSPSSDGKASGDNKGGGSWYMKGKSKRKKSKTESKEAA